MLHIPDKHAALKKVYNYDSFRSLQEDCIDSVCQGSDTAIVMATGAGKSMCLIHHSGGCKRREGANSFPVDISDAGPSARAA